MFDTLPTFKERTSPNLVGYHLGWIGQKNTLGFKNEPLDFKSPQYSCGWEK